MVTDFPDTFVFVQYHWGDEYDTPWVGDRASFYGLDGTPWAWFDGRLSCPGAYTDVSAQYDWYVDQYNARRALPTDVAISMTGMHLSGSTFRIRARIDVEAGGATKSMRVYMVQVLDYFPVFPDEFHNTFKQAAATEYIVLQPGESQIIQRDFAFDSESLAHSDDIKIVVWLQRDLFSGPAEVFQAAVMNWPFAPDCNGNAISDADDIAGGTLADDNGDGVPDTCAAAPAITGQPGDATVCLGTEISFSVETTGYPAPTFQWRRGATNLVNAGRVSGANTATLTINPVLEADGAIDYNCVVTNLFGSVTSNNASLATESIAATITSHPSEQSVCQGHSASFSVTAAGCPAPAYQWRRGTTDLANGGRISGARSATLTISPVNSGDVATDYNCVVTNFSGSATSNSAALVADSVGATITAQPGNQRACLGGAVSFEATATASPAPTYRWFRWDTALVDGDNLSGAQTATLTIDPVGAADFGAGYHVVVSNTCGDALSEYATLLSETGPSLTGHPATQMGRVGTVATFSASAVGAGDVAYQWRKGGINLVDGGRISGAATATLCLNPVARADGGAYDVLVTDACGSATSSAATLWLAGDLNCDGLITYGDINAFVLALHGVGEYVTRYPNCDWLHADINADGQVGAQDINPFIRLLSSP